MSFTISELKKKWSKEKTFYEKQEIGSGVHCFVKNCLESKDLFALKEGSLSAKPESRQNEYIHERKAKEKRKADFVIYINSDIVIPIEVEVYGNIEAGIKQLINYQNDFDKQYGILTDGYTWRFYDNNIYRQFGLDQILDDTETFLEFWYEYIKPETYYLAFFEPRGQLSLLQNEQDLAVDSYRQTFFEDITKLIRSFKNKLKIEGYFEGLDKKEREKRAVEITYAYIIQFILYKTLVDNEFGDSKKEYQLRIEKIHQALQNKSYKEILGIVDGISNYISKNIYHPFAKEQELINQKLLELYHSVENKLSDISPWLDIFVFVKKYDFANIRNEIFGYIYENYLKELYEEQQRGQYFTDPSVVNFMLEQIGFTPDEIKKRLNNEPSRDYVSIIDPSCGSGTFLYSAADQLIRSVPNHAEETSKKLEELIDDNVFGLDIAEFPLYLAEMNILMRMLPLIVHEKYNNPVDKKIKVFKTNDSIAEFMDTAIRNTLSDAEVAYEKSRGQVSLFHEKLNLGYTSYVRDEDDLNEMKKSLENQPQIPRRRFDFVIGNPPYIGYNECARQGILVFHLMKQNKGKVKLSDIYGINLHSIPDHQKKYSPKPNLYAFFIALGLALLKDNGKLCYIIPQTILTAGDLDVLRYHLAKFTTIEKIITFSGKMFIGRGLRQNKPVATSSLVLVISRKKPSDLHQVEVMHYKDPNDNIEKCLANILHGKKVSRKKILQTRFFQSLANWNFIKQDREFLDFYEEYKKKTEDIGIYYNHAWAQVRFGNKFYFDGGGNIHDQKITSVNNNAFEIFDYKNNIYSRYNVTSGSGKYYPKKEKITFPQGSQGVIVHHQRYKIVWRTKDTPRFQFCDKEILLVGNQSLTIASNNRQELLYILALLNSPTIRKILEQNLLQQNEQSFLVPIKAIKEFVRVPKITEDNQFIKDEVIKRTEEMLALEDVMLSDLVDFSNIMVQKFDNVLVKGSHLILTKGKEQVKCKVKKDSGLVQKTIQSLTLGNKLFDEQNFTLSELNSLPAIDFDRQNEIKDYIDDLVFALYFNIPLKSVGFSRANEIKKLCGQSKYY